MIYIAHLVVFISSPAIVEGIAATVVAELFVDPALQQIIAPETISFVCFHHFIFPEN
jgi:hypothetical protein